MIIWKKEAQNEKNLIIAEGDSRNIIIYKDGKNSPRVDVLFRDNMLWLTQKQIGELFGVQKANISKHFKNIFTEGELISIIIERTSSDIGFCQELNFKLAQNMLFALMLNIHVQETAHMFGYFLIIR